MRICLLLIFLLIPQVVHAAYPFCIVRNNVYRECIYDGIDICLKDEDSDTNTYCVLSEDAKLTYSGFLRYCVVDSNLVALCNFNDRKECNRVARGRKNLCVDREIQKDGINPYQYDDRLQ